MERSIEPRYAGLDPRDKDRTDAATELTDEEVAAGVPEHADEEDVEAAPPASTHHGLNHRTE